MAIAEAATWVETRVVEDQKSGIVLRLSTKEASTLMKILGRVGGSPYTTPRVFIDSIASALRDAGISAPSLDIDHTNRSIYFSDTPNNKEFING